MSTDEPRERRGRTAGVFDIRLVIALLFAIYGVVLAFLGATAAPEDIDKAVGVNVNLWSGLGMIVFAGAFTAWALLRPIRVSQGSDTPGSTRDDEQDNSSS